MTVLMLLLLLALAAFGAPWKLGVALFVVWVLHLATQAPPPSDALVDG